MKRGRSFPSLVTLAALGLVVGHVAATPSGVPAPFSVLSALSTTPHYIATDLGSFSRGDTQLWQEGATRSLNAAGQAVGMSWATVEAFHAFRWANGSILDLGTLGGEDSWAVSINASGQVVGGAGIASGASYAFLWQHGEMRDLGTLGAYSRSSEAALINDAGQVVGWSATDRKDKNGHTVLEPFFWENGVMTGMGGLGGRIEPDWEGARSLNATGQVVGALVTSSGASRAFLWQKGILTDLGTLGGREGRAEQINDVGQVIGEAQTAAGHLHAFLWQGGHMTDLGTLGGSWSWADGINAVGQIVGSSETRQTDSQGHLLVHAFLWQNGVMSDLAPLSGSTFSGSLRINTYGQVVGEYGHGDNLPYAFLWERGRLIDLTDLLPDPAGWVSTYRPDIDDLGQIVVSGIYKLRLRTFLLTPSG